MTTTRRLSAAYDARMMEIDRMLRLRDEAQRRITHTVRTMPRI